MSESTLITTPFTARSTAAEVMAGLDLLGRFAVVTGGASPVGIETARALAAAGADVTLAVRDTEAGRRAAEDIIDTTGAREVRIAPLDLTDRASVAAFAAAWQGPLHMLVHNAGVRETPERRTPEGWELQFAVNHLGHFALATGLHGALAETGGARVVVVGSDAHLRAPLDFDDLHFRTRPYDPVAAYGQSRTADVLFAGEAYRRWADDGITVNTLDAGATEAERRTPAQAAATSVLLAASPHVEGAGGRYFQDCAEAPRHLPGGPPRGVAPHALDPEAAARLWQVSLDLLTA
ncbi:SDR family NAD(P)-dependent oxidoreductase [Streptomyces sp. SID3212]|uniref:SDR family NAD(P)-dependent oxidoreductase n=1 Tax=Streptomyces sp. SID3212 TaxID=2690259 RepID=UPI00136B9221|nr:SDR family NAD(P)-dependent oxidoreductase [Streptomyces sp. SID3212]MYV54459.1 SDR family NAD(P)-dependent oxidoreductase [Streptomyces sp. SID3212]